eukprot:gene14258-15745_t
MSSHQNTNQRPMFSGNIKSHIAKAQNTTDVKEKFHILETIIDEFSHSNELNEFFTELLLEIFGYGDYSGWRLNNLYATSHNDETLYKRVYNFLHPYGHMFKLIKKLENENVTVNLPKSVLLNGVSDHVQKSLIERLCQRKLGVAANGGQLDWNRHNDILYVALFEEYLAYFLPITSQNNSKMPSSSSLHDNNINDGKSSDFFSHQRLQPSIQHSSNSLAGIKTIISNTALTSLRRMTWKSELFVQILTDLWFAQGNEPCRSHHTGGVQEYSLPTVDQTLMVRIFIKHMHGFINSDERQQQHEPSHHLHNLTYPATALESQTEELKRVILPTMVNKKLYMFLKNCFSHWPLDPSFKMVLETWLSYIQPWRYNTNADQNTSTEIELENWRDFIGDNLLFYTVFFRMFVSRAERFDLHCLKDIQMIQRLTKVFSQADLAEILHTVEAEFVTSPGLPGMQRFSASRLGSSFSNLRPVLKRIELEDPEQQYQPILDRLFITKVENLAQKLFNKSESLKQELVSKSKPTDKGVAAKLKAFFTAEDNEEGNIHIGKLIEYLDRICVELANIFDFIPPKSSSHELDNTDSVSGAGNAIPLPRPFSADKCYENGTLLPEHVISNDGNVTLTERGRRQIIQQLRQFKIQGKACRDLEPVKTYEIHFLVRWMYTVSVMLNIRLKRPLTELYNREDLIGRSLRKLSPNVCSQHGLSVKLPDAIPVGSIEPRISLRFMSSYYTIYYVAWLLLISKLFGFGLLQVVLLFIVMFVLFALQNMDSNPEKSVDARH